MGYYSMSMLKKIILLVFVFGTTNAIAQKKIIDTVAYSHWAHIRNVAISNDGKYALYTIGHSDGGAANEVVIKATSGKWEKSVHNVNNAIFTANSREAAVQISGDSLCLITLGGDLINYIKNVKYLPAQSSDDLIYLSNPNTLVIQNLLTGKSTKFYDVRDWRINAQGTALVADTVDLDEHKDHLCLVDLNRRKSSDIFNGGRVGQFTFNNGGDQLAFIEQFSNNSTISFRVWHCDKTWAKAKVLLDSNQSVLNQRLNFSKDGAKLYFSTQGKHTKNMGHYLNGVTVWGYKDQYLQSYLKTSDGINLQINPKEKKVIDIRTGKVSFLSDSDENQIFSHDTDNNNYLLCFKKPSLDSYFKPDQNLYLVSVANGQRKIVETNRFSTPVLSPGENFVVWFSPDSLSITSEVYEIETESKEINISRSVPELLYKLI